jgi:hypothetical protein
MRVSRQVLMAYWRAMPSPYDIDTENVEAAKHHIRVIVKALSIDQSPEETDQAPRRFVEEER